MHSHAYHFLRLIVVALGVRCIYSSVSAFVHLCCACVIHLSHTHTDGVVDLLINVSMYICVSMAFILFCSCEEYSSFRVTLAPI